MYVSEYRKRITKKETEERKKRRHSLDERWKGLTVTEKEEVMDIFNKIEKKRINNIETI